MYYKQIEDGYIMAIGTGGGIEITEDEYNTILSVIYSKPPSTDVLSYRLKEDLTWEPYIIDISEDMEESNDNS